MAFRSTTDGERRIAGGEHQQGRGFLVAAGPRDHIDAGSAGHAPVDDRDVVVVPLELVDGVIAPVDGVDLVALIFEAEDQDFAQPEIVFSDEDAHRGWWARASSWAECAPNSCRSRYVSAGRERFVRWRQPASRRSFSRRISRRSMPSTVRFTTGAIN